MFTITEKKRFVCLHCARQNKPHKALGYCELCYRQHQYHLHKGSVDKWTETNKIKPLTHLPN